jgi:hypothetical protein
MRGLGVIALVAGAAAVVGSGFAQALPAVYLNHATIFLPSEAYTALLQSQFLRSEFSGFQEQTVQRDGGAWSYTGIYLFGQHTYLEFFKDGSVQALGNFVAGDIVFNMSIDDRRQLPLFRDLLSAEKHDTMVINTARNGQNAPTFDSVMSRTGPEIILGPGLRVTTALKGYYPDGITRERQRESRFVPERALRDIIGFTLTGNAAERAKLKQEFRAYSYAISVEGEQITASGPEVAIVVVPPTLNTSRILTIDMSLNRTAGEERYKLGEGSDLRIHGNIAKWIFTFPSK